MASNEQPVVPKTKSQPHDTTPAVFCVQGVVMAERLAHLPAMHIPL